MKYVTKKNIKLPRRRKDSHKGDHGRVMVVGGSKEFIGAVTLAGIAALRSGVDLCVVASPSKTAWAVSCIYPDLITMKLKGEYLSFSHFDFILKEIDKFDTILIGNGAGVKAGTKKLFQKLVKIKKQFVIDADGVKAIDDSNIVDSIITPHMREFEIFLQNSKKSYFIKKLKQEKNLEKKAKLIQEELYEFLKRGNIILLKGVIDIIISKDKIMFNKTGNAGLTKGGTGDVLAGLCTGFYSQLGDSFQAAINGAYFNGLIGDILLKKHRGYSYLASDMVEEIKKVVK